MQYPPGCDPLNETIEKAIEDKECIACRYYNCGCDILLLPNTIESKRCFVVENDTLIYERIKDKLEADRDNQNIPE